MISPQIFEGLTVIELASVLAGPAVGQFFAELGATVIKVENHMCGGDVTRSWRLANEEGVNSAYFTSVNWGKKSVGIDLNTVEGRQITHELVARADIVLTSFKPGSAGKLQMDYEHLSTLNPKLLYGSITGYGKDDPRVGYDALIQAETGFMHINGEKDSEPLKLPVAMIDILAAHQLKEALLLAIIQRMQTGRGSEVSVSLYDAAIASLANQGANYLVAGHDPEASGSLHPNIAPYGEVLITRDQKRILLAIGTDRQFQQLLEILNLDELQEDVRFTNNVNRVANREALASELKCAAVEMDSEDLLARCRQLHIPAGIISRISDALEQLPVHMSLESVGVQGIRTFVAGGQRSLLPPPELGNDGWGILKEYLSLSHSTYKDLQTRNILA